MDIETIKHTCPITFISAGSFIEEKHIPASYFFINPFILHYKGRLEQYLSDEVNYIVIDRGINHKFTPLEILKLQLSHSQWLISLDVIENPKNNISTQEKWFTETYKPFILSLLDKAYDTNPLDLYSYNTTCLDITFGLSGGTLLNHLRVNQDGCDSEELTRRKIFDQHINPQIQLVFTLQGDSSYEYLSQLEALQDSSIYGYIAHSIPNSIIALGGLIKKTSQSKRNIINKVSPAIRSVFGKQIKIHGFGLGPELLDTLIQNQIYSHDSSTIMLLAARRDQLEFNERTLRLERIHATPDLHLTKTEQKIQIAIKSYFATLKYKQALVENLKRFGTIKKHTPALVSYCK